MSRITGGAAVLLMAGCAAVATQVTLLDPAAVHPQAQHVEILLEPATRAHVTVALIEARGIVGTPEDELLEAARNEAASVGADAVVRLGVTRIVRPPLEIYDPVFSPFYSRYALRAGTQFYPPYLGHYRRVGGVEVLTLKALAIRYGGGEERSGQ